MIAPSYTKCGLRLFLAAACAVMIACGTTGGGGSSSASPSGTTASATAHSVQLKWVASASTDVIGYNVYRAGSSAGPYSVVTNTGTSTAYLDTAVQSGQTYYYQVTALNSFAESSPTSPVSATIP